MPETLHTEELHASADEIATIPVFADLQAHQLAWLAAHSIVAEFKQGEIIVREGSTAEYMSIILKGGMQGRIQGGGQDRPLFMAQAGQVTGLLPYSRLKVFPTNVRAVGDTRIAQLHSTLFAEMLQVIPVLSERLVGLLSDRIRESTKVNQNFEKMAALGKLSAGLAHELNNPASAARRAASSLRGAMERLAEANRRLAGKPLADEHREKLAELERGFAAGIDSLPPLDSLEQSDIEDEIGGWLTRHQIPAKRDLTPVFAESGVNTKSLDSILALVGPDLIGDVLSRTAATLATERLRREIESSTDRIAILVKAIKEYSYMDRMKEEEIDLHRGLDTTLTILGHCLKGGIKVIREYDKTVPKILANGGELNQVWTNLIDNSIEAMDGKGELRIRTSREAEMVMVEIADTGPGIPEELQTRIFEPFFTTKGVGEGTGLGLEFVYRIVKRHRGDVRVTSQPGDTRFQIRLPIALPGSQSADPLPSEPEARY